MNFAASAMNPNRNTISTADDQECCSYSAKIYENHNINKPDQRGNMPLHNAVIQNDVKLLSHLLHQSSIDVDVKNHNGETPLLLALSLCRSHSFINHLIHAGCDPNITNKFTQNSLHLALLCSSVDVAHQLVKSGANVNQRDRYKQTPLHYAVKNGDLEAVCMLLYYEADVNCECVSNMTPLSLAVCCNRFEIVKELVDYYDELSGDLLCMIIWQQNPFNLDTDLDDDFNLLNNIAVSLEYNRIELFELIWSRIDHQLLVNTKEPFLLNFLSPEIKFSAAEWLKLLYLVFESSAITELMEELRKPFGYFDDVLYIFHALAISPDDRIKIISTCLSFGWEIDIININFVSILFTFEELGMFLYCTDHIIGVRIGFYHHVVVDDSKYQLFPQCSCIFSTEHPTLEYVVKSIEFMFYSAFEFFKFNPMIIENCVLNNLSFFALPAYSKQSLFNTYQSFLNKHPVIRKKLETLPEIPSLIELSRNEICSYIKHTFKFTKAYQFHDIVKKLNLPDRIQDMLCFKISLY